MENFNLEQLFYQIILILLVIQYTYVVIALITLDIKNKKDFYFLLIPVIPVITKAPRLVLRFFKALTFGYKNLK